MNAVQTTAGPLAWDEPGSGPVGSTNGPTVVLLAPGARPARYFGPSVVEQLATGVAGRVVRIDLPGHGRSLSVDGPLVFDDIVAAIGATLGEMDEIDEASEADGAAVHLVGVGLSGLLALAVAEISPSRVSTVAAISTSAFVADPGLAGPDEMLVASISIRQDTSTPEAMFGTLTNHEHRLHGIEDPKEIRAWVEWGVDPSERFRRLFLTTRFSDERLGAIPTPVVVIHGSDDPMIPPVHAERLAAQLPHAELDVVPGMGHGLTTGFEARIIERVVAHIDRYR